MGITTRMLELKGITTPALGAPPLLNLRRGAFSRLKAPHLRLRRGGAPSAGVVLNRE
jgi:hypothetical protein